MYLDEKIALMERARRQKEKEEREASKRGQEENQGEKLELEDALQGILKGELRLPNEEHLEFEPRVYTNQNIPMMVFKNFYEASKEEEEGTIYVNHNRQVSQILSWPKKQVKPVPFQKWENQLVNGMASSGLHAKVGKKQQLKALEYLCFEVPTGEGWLYNIIFRKKGKEQTISGNYNCLKEDKDTYGIILEAMVMALDQWFTDGEGGGLFGEENGDKTGK